MSSFIKKTASATGLFFGAALIAAAAGTWTAAPANPPTGNVEAPVNVSSIAQAKPGLLGLTELLATRLNTTANTAVGGTAPAYGNILMSLDAQGTAKWVATSTLGVGGGNNTSSSSLKSWVDSVPMSPGRSFTVNHGFSGVPLYKASIVKVVAHTGSANPDVDNIPVGTELGIESFFQWDNSYDNPFSMIANGTTLTLRLNSGIEILYDGRINTAISAAQMGNWRLKITAIGPTNATATTYTNQPSSLFVKLDLYTGNNTNANSVAYILEPGTYTFSGKITTACNGGGGWDGVGLFDSDSVDMQSFLNGLYGTPVTSKTLPDSSYRAYYNNDNPSLLFALKRDCYNNDGSYTIPETTVNIASRKYLKVTTGQSYMTGYLYGH